MARYLAIIVLACALLVGTSSGYPQTRAHRQTEDGDVKTDGDAPVDADVNTLEDAVTEAVTISPRHAPAASDDYQDNSNNNEAEEDNALGLPSNATSIRAKIVDSFTCEGRVYGYYADVDNECQIFHVCLPVMGAGGRGQTFKWSFICPEQTIFNQESFTCTRPEDALPCEEAPQFYSLNDNFGVTGSPDQSVASRSGDADVDVASRTSDEDISSRTADQDIASRTADQDIASRTSDEDVASKTSVDDVPVTAEEEASSPSAVQEETTAVAAAEQEES